MNFPDRHPTAPWVLTVSPELQRRALELITGIWDYDPTMPHSHLTLVVDPDLPPKGWHISYIKTKPRHP